MENIDADVKDRVSARLAMARLLIADAERVEIADNFRNLPNGGWSHPYIEHYALVNYLLLTCFDILGHHLDEYIDFRPWLTSKKAKHKAEREAAGPLDPDPIVAATQLCEAHTEIYGFRRGFKRFVNEMLAEPARVELLHSVAIRKEGAWVHDPKLKVDFLLTARNKFTHEAVANIGRVLHDTRILGPEGFQPLYAHLYVEDGCSYLVSDWPFILYEVVAGFIGEDVPDFPVVFTVHIDVGEASYVVREKVTRAELKSPNVLREQARAWRAANPV